MSSAVTTRAPWWEQYMVALPEGEIDTLRLVRQVVTKSDADLDRLRSVIGGHGRYVREGTYTSLLDGGRLWMSDTPDEIGDHLGAIHRIERPSTRRVLINGLGIGMVLRAALACEHVEHVDVVEIDPRVVALVGPHYACSRLTIHTADAYTVPWPANTRWDVAWHDIWPDICEDNLDGMARLHRRYGRRAEWQGSWCRERLLAERRRTADAWWRR